MVSVGAALVAAQYAMCWAATRAAPTNTNQRFSHTTKNIRSDNHMENNYSKLVKSIAAKYLKDKYFETIRLYPEFYFEKARTALLILQQLPTDAHLYIDFLERYQTQSLGFEQFVAQLPTENGLAELGLSLARCLVYLDNRLMLCNKFALT